MHRCQSCIAACPSAAIFYDSVTSKVIKCDTCDGDPECAKVCYTRALLWVETENIDKFEREKLQSRYFTREKVGPKKMD